MESIYPLISVIIGAVIGSYMTYIATIKVKFAEKKLEYKATKYGELIVNLKILVGSKKPLNTDDVNNLILNKQYEIWLFASEEVIVAIDDLLTHARSETYDENQGIKFLAEVVISMRKDIGVKTSISHKYFRYTNQS